MTVPNAHDKVVQLVRLKGPLMPSQINKELDTSILFASAILGELTSKKVLKISNLKVGGTPLYYYPGQEYKLQQFVDKLHPKEKDAFELLRSRIVLADDRQQPVVRSALREIKDFARPLQVTLDGKTQLFWKWYLLSNEDAEKRIKEIIGFRDEPRQEPVQKRIDEQTERKPAERVEERMPSAMPERKPLQQAAERKLQPILERRIEPKPQPAKARQETRPEPKEARHDIKREIQKELAKDPGREPSAEEPKDKFFRRIKNYFDGSSIKMLDFKIIRKEADIEFTVQIPSTVGTLTYFCKAKNKKKVNDGDLSSVYIQAQSKKMPVLFLTTGELTKKAKELLDKEFRNVSVKKV